MNGKNNHPHHESSFQMSKLTACLVSANRPIELRIAIDSLRAQTLHDFDVLLSDDSATPEIRNYFLDKFPNGKYFHHHPPLGEIQNTNFAIANAKTEYIVLCHDDDYFAKNYFEACFTEMLKNPSIDLAYSGRIIVDQNNNYLTRNLMVGNKLQYQYPATLILDYMLFNRRNFNYRVFINTPGLFFRKSKFSDAEGLNENVNTHCDTEFLLKILAISNNVLYINSPLYFSKVWNNSSGRSRSSENHEVFEAELGVLDLFIDFAFRKNIQHIDAEKIFSGVLANQKITSQDLRGSM